MIRQYKKNIGRLVEVVLNDETRYEGKLISVEDSAIQIEYTEGKNKKAVTMVKELPFEQVKQTTVQIVF